MLSFNVPPTPTPHPEIIPGYVVQIRYATGPDGRIFPFDPDDHGYDLMFREWTPNGFASRATGADEIHAAHLATGFESRILNGVAERQANGEFMFFTVH